MGGRSRRALADRRGGTVKLSTRRVSRDYHRPLGLPQSQPAPVVAHGKVVVMLQKPLRIWARLSPITVMGTALLVAACGAGPGAPTDAALASAAATPTAVPGTATPLPTPTVLPSEAPCTLT